MFRQHNSTQTINTGCSFSTEQGHTRIRLLSMNDITLGTIKHQLLTFTAYRRAHVCQRVTASTLSECQTTAQHISHPLITEERYILFLLILISSQCNREWSHHGA